jgi:hypothetical protein
MASSAQTKNARPDEQPDTDDRARPNGHHADETTARAEAPADDAAREATAAPTAPVGAILRQGQDGALRTARMWAELFRLMNPVALVGATVADEPADVRHPEDRLGRLGEVAVSSAVSWSDNAFDTIATALATQRRFVDEVLVVQRRYVDQVLGTQRRLVGQLLGAAATRGTPPGTGSARS